MWMWSVSYHAPQTVSESCYVIFGLWNASSHQYIYNSFIVNATSNDSQAVNSYNLIYFTSWMDWTHMNPHIWPLEPAGRTLSACTRKRCFQGVFSNSYHIKIIAEYSSHCQNCVPYPWQVYLEPMIKSITKGARYMVKDRVVDELPSLVCPMKNCRNTMSATMTINLVSSGMWSNACTCIISPPTCTLTYSLQKHMTVLLTQ